MTLALSVMASIFRPHRPYPQWVGFGRAANNAFYLWCRPTEDCPPVRNQVHCHRVFCLPLTPGRACHFGADHHWKAL